VRVAQHHEQPALLRRGQRLVVLQDHLGVAQDAGKRRAQLVRDGRDEDVLLLVQRAQLADQPVLLAAQPLLAHRVLDLGGQGDQQLLLLARPVGPVVRLLSALFCPG
jgi:hypothetical protein